MVYHENRLPSVTPPHYVAPATSYNLDSRLLVGTTARLRPSTSTRSALLEGDSGADQRLGIALLFRLARRCLRLGNCA